VRETATADLRVLHAAHALSIDRVTAEVVAAFDVAGIPSILLKGPSIARWLYPKGGRRYGDTDLLVAPGRRAEAARVLESLGFREQLEGFVAFERAAEAPETAFIRSRVAGAPRGEIVDLHHTLPGVPVDGDVVWTKLSAATDSMVVGGHEVRVLDRTGIALHIVLHAAQHRFEFHTDEDLRRAVDSVTSDDWRDVMLLARELDVEDVVHATLRRDERLVPPAGGIQLERLLAAQSIGEKARILRWQLLPSPARARYVAGRPPELRPPILVAYLRHWRRLATSIVPAWRHVMTERRHGRAEGRHT
jgi:hypothetical protein